MKPQRKNNIILLIENKLVPGEKAPVTHQKITQQKIKTQNRIREICQNQLDFDSDFEVYNIPRPHYNILERTKRPRLFRPYYPTVQYLNVAFSPETKTAQKQ